MEYFIFVLLICFFLFLFCLFVFCNDDYVLFKKHITVEKVFNIAILVGLYSLFFARIFYVVFHFAPGFLNPLVFFLFPYFPGLSFAGGVIGGILFFVIYLHLAKFPIGRLFDFFSLSLLYTFPLGLLLYFVLAEKLTIFLPIAIPLLFCMAFLLKKLLHKGSLAEGSIGALSLLFLSAAVCVVTMLYNTKDSIVFSFSGEFILSFILFVLFLLFFIKQERSTLIHFFLRK